MPVKDIIHKTRSAPYVSKTYPRQGNVIYRAQFKVDLWKPSPDSAQAAHFGITGTISRHKVPLDHPNAFVAFGCLHDELIALRAALQGKDKILPDLLKWHLFDVREGPMHYAGNAAYRMQQWLRAQGRLTRSSKSWMNPDPKDDSESLFKHSVLFGVLEDDALPVIPEFRRPPDHSDRWVYDSAYASTRRAAWEAECERRIEASVTEWCARRLPRLMARFEADMVAWFGEDILES